MIDIHCHLLPGIDDGAKDLNASLSLARQLSQAGFQKVIATPHVFEGREFLVPQTIKDATLRLNHELERQDIPLEVFPGAEYYIFPDLPRYLKEGKILTLADSQKYLLVELPMQELPHYTEHVIFELQVQGIVAVLAHPERYSYLVEARELLIKWRRSGVLLQVDLRSLQGFFGPGPLELASWLLENGLVQLIGTDAHRASRYECGCKKALQYFSQRVGLHQFEGYLETNPQAILEGKELVSLEEERRIIPFHRKKRRWGLEMSIRERMRTLFPLIDDKDFPL